MDKMEEDEENRIEIKVQGNDPDSKKTFKVLKVTFVIYQLKLFLSWSSISQSVRGNIKTNRGSLTHVFPRFTSATCTCFEF